MHLLAWILLMTGIVSLVSLIGVFTLWMKDATFRKILFALVALSTGALLGGGLLHLAAESIGVLGTDAAFMLLIAGFSVFFLLEKFLFWHHCHEGKCDVHPYTYLILFGDGIHNFIDGLLIAASFFVNPAFGIVTTMIIISHEVPQELGDFGVLVHGGMKKRKALLYNLLSQMSCMLGGIVGYFASGIGGFQVSFLLPFAAGGFVYIAASDLIPELHKETDKKKSIIAFAFFVIGVLLMLGFKLAFGE